MKGLPWNCGQNALRGNPVDAMVHTGDTIWGYRPVSFPSWRFAVGLKKSRESIGRGTSPMTVP